MFEEMLQEKEEIAAKRKRCKEILRVLQQAAWVPSLLLHIYDQFDRAFSTFLHYIFHEASY